ncbi:choice-of-anchor I family protein [Limnoraphis robusta]|uniref:Choice-of-anchor I family protein n=1 Tax=Limnoraphis robusta CCNP1315 TaxID=3110306 RepID=A0ABU5U570_9CYAN|nr:choice-of-anchor I family protein [Limnoraphis robusta]MEA5522235.1 choice-of-anchor I family protein [Limnoraphis robusta CCNP1315]MEA5549175.1 choice-of-anchor I family protein [Limnoraphis robusta CCNP1324]
MRFATFNASLNRNTAGQLITDLTRPDNEQAQDIAEIIQQVNPDVLLINEFDYNAENPEQAINFFRDNYLEIGQNGATPVEYEYVYVAPSNTGVVSEFDLDNNGATVTTPGADGYGNDALGFGNFPGQFGMVLLSKYPIDTENVRTFKNFLWKDMPENLLPDDPATPEPNDKWYSAEELAELPLSSKSHWDVPIEVDGEMIHVLVSHPTPPTFDGEEDRNGRRNHDEIRFWSDYVTPGAGDYIYDDDDEAPTGGLTEGSAFVIMGDQNADPLDGDSTNDAILQLLENPNIQGSATDINITPDSNGGVVAATDQAGANVGQQGNPAFDTADFGDEAPGNLRVDYVLPSTNLVIDDAQVFWPAPGTPGSELVAASDHRLVFADLAFEEESAFTLQILHTSDQEAGIPALNDAPGLSAVMNALEDDFENTIKLSSGDLYISGPFFDASRDIYNTTAEEEPEPAGQPGIADILIQNELGWDAAAVGNHEFDAGDSTFFSLLAPNPNWVNGTGQGIGEGGYPGASFPYLATNLDYTNATLPEGLTVVESGLPAQPNSLTGSVVVDVNGEQVAVLGVVTPYLPSIANIGGVEMETGDGISAGTPIADQVAALVANLQPEVQLLTDAGINKIILMTHLQEAEIEQALAEALDSQNIPIDVMIGGGSHRVMTDETTVPPLREDETQQNTPGLILQPYPQIYNSDEDEDQVFYINTGANYRYLSRLVTNFDENGVVTSISEEESGTFATDIAGVNRLYEEEITTLDQVKAVADPELVSIVDGVGEFVNSLDANIFGQTEVFLNGIRGDVRTQETNLGNLSTDAQDYYAEEYLTAGLLGEAFSDFDEIDISFKNGGGIRDIIGVSSIAGGGGELVQGPPAANPNVGKEEGDISQLDLSNSLRFDNSLVVGTVSAAGLYEIAEHMVARVENVAGQFGQISGFKFSYDPTAQGRTSEQPGERIQNLALTDDDGNVKEIIVQEGELVGDPERTFSLVTLEFLAGGGDSYPNVIQNQVPLSTLTQPESLANAELEAGREQDALAEYLAAFFNSENEQDPFSEPDTPQSEDERIQNLAVREDTVLSDDDDTPQPQPLAEVLKLQGSFETGIFDDSASQINVFDLTTQRAFVTNNANVSLDIIDFSNPAEPTLFKQVNVSEFGGVVNSVAVFEGLVVVAVEADVSQENGKIVFLDLEGNIQGEAITVGALPDMLTFTPDGSKILVANEGEPSQDYTNDPEGSISIIDVATREVTSVTFTAFDSQIEQLKQAGVRIFGPNATVSKDLEPEYIAVSSDSTTAYVALQENNAIAVVDIASSTITDILPLGFKDHSLIPLDASDEDGEINISTYENLFGLYQPDAIATYEANDVTYIVTANEGDSRDYDGFSEEDQIENITLDSTTFPNAAELQLPENLGRLEVTTTLGDTDNDGDFDELYAFGGRSFSIWEPTEEGLELVFDSGDQFEQIIAKQFPDFFNTTNDDNAFDDRSDNKGSEPEGVAVGEIDGKTYAFISLERMGGIMSYDITNPSQPQFLEYINDRDFTGDPEAGTAGDLAPEGMTFVPGENPQLIVSNEVSGTTTSYSITAQNSAPVLVETPDLSLGELENLSNSDNLEGISIAEFVGEISSDTDDDDIGIAIAGVDNTNGTWEYSIDNGTTWISITGVSQENALVLNSTAQIRFIATSITFTGTIERAITFFAWDGTFSESGSFVNVTQTGLTTAFSQISQTASLTVIEQQNIPPVVVDEIPNQTAQVNIGFSLNLAENFQDEDDDPLTFSSPNLPRGLTIDETTGLIIGTPINEGTFNVTVVASDGEAEIETSFELAVSPFVIPVIPPLPDDDDGETPEPPVDDGDDDDGDDDGETPEPPVDDDDDDETPEPPVDDDDDDDDDDDGDDDGETPEPPVPPVDVDVPVRQPNTTTNTIEGDETENELLGTAENEDLFGFQGNDILAALNGDDNIYGGGEDDLIFAGQGDDNCYGDVGNDSIFGGIGGTIPGDDSSDIDYIEGGDGNDIIFGNKDADTLIGDGGDDIIFAGKDDDLVSGGEGNDFITGDEGNDTLLGGNGRDRFLFVEGAGTDLIADYENGQDLFVLGEGLTFDQLTIIQVSGLTQIQVSSTDEVLATLPGIAVGDIGEEDFTLFEPIETPLDS